jgi:hypothetical protein
MSTQNRKKVVEIIFSDLFDLIEISMFVVFPAVVGVFPPTTSASANCEEV